MLSMISALKGGGQKSCVFAEKGAAEKGASHALGSLSVLTTAPFKSGTTRFGTGVQPQNDCVLPLRAGTMHAIGLA